MTLAQRIFDMIPEAEAAGWFIRKQDNAEALAAAQENPPEGHTVYGEHVQEIFLGERRWEGDTLGRIWMSNVPWEMGTHEEFKEQVTGDVLIGGLGLGYNALYAYEKGVGRIDVVELRQSVIDLVWPHIVGDTGMNIYHSDIYRYLMQTENTYDFIWFDVFPNDPEYHPAERDMLIAAANARLKPGGKILFWRCNPEFKIDIEAL